MDDRIDWELLYLDYIRWRSEARSGSLPKKQFDPANALATLANPSDHDARWLIGALRNGDPAQRRAWFVAALCRRSESVADIFFVPLLDAAIDEVDPSSNRWFVEPCMERFGPRRVNEYLLSVVESGTDFRIAGAVNALYWAQVPLSFRNVALDGELPSFDIEHATPESRGAYMALQDVWARKNRLFLETFVGNPSVQVRRSIIPALNLDLQRCPESHRLLVTQAIDIARSHEDEYIRDRVEVQLGDMRPLMPLPPRDTE